MGGVTAEFEDEVGEEHVEEEEEKGEVVAGVEAVPEGADEESNYSRLLFRHLHSLID